MESYKTAKIIANTIYAIGAVIALALVCVSLFGSSEPMNPEAMLPFSRKEQAFIGLAVGSIPMLLACMAVYKFNKVKESLHKKRTFCLVFLPGFVCGACALFIAGLFAVGYVNMFANWGR
jgi:uncharacterized membrane protein YdcZ (DUF606 family)